jgi:hypothetical protein
MTGVMRPPALELVGLVKRFGDTTPGGPSCSCWPC